MYTFPMEFVPLEKNVLSLELENSYKSIFLVCFVSAFIESAAEFTHRTATTALSTIWEKP